VRRSASLAHTCARVPQPQNPTFAFIGPLIPSKTSLTSLQRFGPFFYAASHARKVDGGTRGKYARDGEIPVRVDDGWEVAPGDDSDLQVCSQHPWQSDCPVFADGDVAGTSICSDPPWIGTEAFWGGTLRIAFPNICLK